jgi:hypothetical protein
MPNKYIWLSFSLDGVNQGVCNVQADNISDAFYKACELKIVPKHDDFEAFELEEAELPVDILFTRQQMIDKDYESEKYKKPI